MNVSATRRQQRKKENGLKLSSSSLLWTRGRKARKTRTGRTKLSWAKAAKPPGRAESFLLDSSRSSWKRQLRHRRRRPEQLRFGRPSTSPSPTSPIRNCRARRRRPAPSRPRRPLKQQPRQQRRQQHLVVEGRSDGRTVGRTNQTHKKWGQWQETKKKKPSRVRHRTMPSSSSPRSCGR